MGSPFAGYNNTSQNTYECCRFCTPEQGRKAEDEYGRNCHTYCDRYLKAVEKSKADKELKKKKERESLAYIAYRAQKSQQRI